MSHEKLLKRLIKKAFDYAWACDPRHSTIKEDWDDFRYRMEVEDNFVFGPTRFLPIGGDDSIPLEPYRKEES